MCYGIRCTATKYLFHKQDGTIPDTTCLTFRAVFFPLSSNRSESFSNVLRPEDGERQAADPQKLSSTKTDSVMIRKLEFADTVLSGAVDQYQLIPRRLSTPLYDFPTDRPRFKTSQLHSH